MDFKILHESSGRLRVHAMQHRMSFAEADTLLYYLKHIDGVGHVTVHEDTCDAIIEYKCGRSAVVKALSAFTYETANVPAEFIKNSGRELSAEYRDKIIGKVCVKFIRDLYFPAWINAAIAVVKSFKYIGKGLNSIFHKKVEVSILDAAAISVSILRGDFSTAGSVMFLLDIGDMLEEWTHKRTVNDLANTMSLNVEKVWLVSGDSEVLVKRDDVKAGDEIVVHMGSVIPFDGIVTNGEAMVNQASMTGESVPVKKSEGITVYAGTVVEEGEVTFKVTKTGGNSRYESIVKMIEETEKLMSGVESQAEHLADRLVPYTLIGAPLVYLFTRNVTKALSVLMVDFSCALKLAMPVSVLSAIREASDYDITVKGGKFLEAVADADTIVFDKTGTLTKAEPVVRNVISFNGMSEDELLRIAACLEEHFPHSIANAVVNAAKARDLRHDEMHSKVNYIVAHGISTTIMNTGEKAIIGSFHFVFEDEHTAIPDGMEERFKNIPDDCSRLYLAVGGSLAAVICIEDPLRPEVKSVIRELKKVGIRNVVMMTGDNKKTAAAIATKAGVDTYYAEVLPEDKAKFVEEEKAKGHKVIMIGDGINDSPALSAADCGVAISNGAEIAREIADVTISASDLHQIVVLKELSNLLMARIKRHYRFIVGFNSGLIALGVAGVIQPATSALLHNTSTLLIGLRSTSDLLTDEDDGR